MNKTISPTEFIDRVIKLNEKGQPWRLAPYQRKVLELAFKRKPNGALVYRQIVISDVKKSGKTFLSACLALWWSFITPNSEVIISANDREQAISRVFKTMCDLIEKNPALEQECEVYSNSISMNNGTTILAISSDYKGAAGSRHSLAVFDELWGAEGEAARRLFDELTPPPSEFSSWQLITSYAGFSGESNLLEEIYKRGVQGKRIDENLEAYKADDLFMYWSHSGRQPWLMGKEGEEYYQSQQRILRPNQFQRLHRNEWVNSESAFISPEVYAACVVDGHPDLSGSLFIGVDAAVRKDNAAIICLKYADDSDQLVLADYKIWKPLPGQPINLEASVEFYLRRVYSNPNSHIEKILVDPYQMARSVQTLQAACLPIEEYNQTQGNLTEATEALYAAFINRNLRLYHAADLRQHCLNAVSVETPRGIRLSKQKTANKIDAAVALSFAVLAAIRGGKPPPLNDAGRDDDKPFKQGWDARYDWSYRN